MHFPNVITELLKLPKAPGVHLAPTHIAVDWRAFIAAAFTDPTLQQHKDWYQATLLTHFRPAYDATKDDIVAPVPNDLSALERMKRATTAHDVDDDIAQLRVQQHTYTEQLRVQSPGCIQLFAQAMNASFAPFSPDDPVAMYSELTQTPTAPNAPVSVFSRDRMTEPALLRCEPQTPLPAMFQYSPPNQWVRELRQILSLSIADMPTYGLFYENTTNTRAVWDIHAWLQGTLRHEVTGLHRQYWPQVSSRSGYMVPSVNPDKLDEVTQKATRHAISALTPYLRTRPENTWMYKMQQYGGVDDTPFDATLVLSLSKFETAAKRSRNAKKGYKKSYDLPSYSMLAGAKELEAAEDEAIAAASSDPVLKQVGTVALPIPYECQGNMHDTDTDEILTASSVKLGFRHYRNRMWVTFFNELESEGVIAAEHTERCARNYKGYWFYPYTELRTLHVAPRMQERWRLFLRRLSEDGNVLLCEKYNDPATVGALLFELLSRRGLAYLTPVDIARCVFDTEYKARVAACSAGARKHLGPICHTEVREVHMAFKSRRVQDPLKDLPKLLPHRSEAFIARFMPDYRADAYRAAQRGVLKSFTGLPKTPGEVLAELGYISKQTLMQPRRMQALSARAKEREQIERDELEHTAKGTVRYIPDYFGPLCLP